MPNNVYTMSPLRKRFVIAGTIYGSLFTIFGVWLALRGGNPMEAVFGLPLTVLVPFLLGHSLLSALILVELIRAVLNGRVAWSGRRHLCFVAIGWILLFAVQIPMIVYTEHW